MKKERPGALTPGPQQSHNPNGSKIHRQDCHGEAFVYPRLTSRDRELEARRIGDALDRRREQLRALGLRPRDRGSDLAIARGMATAHAAGHWTRIDREVFAYTVRRAAARGELATVSVFAIPRSEAA